MLSHHTVPLYKFNIEFVTSKVNPSQETWIVTCEDLKTLKKYEQQYELSELIDSNIILQIFPKLLDSIVRTQQPNINFGKNGVHIIWRFNITCAWKESVQLIIKEKVVQNTIDTSKN